MPRGERSESLDEREASARIDDVMVVRNFAVSENRCSEIQRMDRASTRDRLRAHCGAVCEAVLASVACVNERSQTATKIFSEDRPRRVACQSRRSRHVRSARDPCVARPAEFPDTEPCVARRGVSQLEDDSFRTNSHTQHLLGGAQRRVIRSVRLALDAGAGVEPLAQCAVIPQDLTRRRTRARSLFSRRRLSPLRRAVTFVRTRWGVSDPHPNGSGAASGGWQRGSLTPQLAVHHHPRGFGGGEERRLDHQHVASRSLGSSVTCQGHANPGAVRGVQVHKRLPLSGQGGTLLPRLCSPSHAPLLSVGGERMPRCFRSQPGREREQSRRHAGRPSLVRARLLRTAVTGCTRLDRPDHASRPRSTRSGPRRAPGGAPASRQEGGSGANRTGALSSGRGFQRTSSAVARHGARGLHSIRLGARCRNEFPLPIGGASGHKPAPQFC